MKRTVWKVVSGIAIVSAAVLLTMNLAEAKAPAVRASDSYVQVNRMNFPDEHFREYVTTIAGDDGMLSPEERDAVTSIVLNNTEIESVWGIEYFENLTSLEVKNNKLTSIDISKNQKLETLNCLGNQISTLDLSKNAALKEVWCAYNKITSLDVSKNTSLTLLSCGSDTDTPADERLKSINVKGAKALRKLYLTGHALTSIDLSENTELIELSLARNSSELNAAYPFTSFDISHNTKLTKLDISYLSLTSLDLSKNASLESVTSNGLQMTKLDLSGASSLKYFTCSDATCKTIIMPTDRSKLSKVKITNTQMSKIDVSGANKLTEIRCDGNPNLTSLVCTGCTSLETLYVNYNPKLASLNTSSLTSLKKLYCINNALTSLTVSSNSNLEYLSCAGNQFEKLDVSKNGKLKTLYCDQEKYKDTCKKVTELIVSGAPALERIEIGYNALTSLDASNLPYLYNLHCIHNNLQTLTLTSTNHLTYLDCRYNALQNLDLSSSLELQELDCSFNKLTKMNLSKSASLRELNCRDNLLTSVDLTACVNLTYFGSYNNTQMTTLKLPVSETALYLDCSKNKIKELDLSKSTIKYLSCSENELTKLTIGNSTKLTTVLCDKNKLTSLNVSGCTNLTELRCDKNNLTSLVVSGASKLQKINCEFNSLTSLDVSNLTSLTLLKCGGNKLTKLTLSGASALEELYCQANSLTSLNVASNVALKKLLCYDNKIGSITIDACPELVIAAKGDFGFYIDVFNGKTYFDTHGFPKGVSHSSERVIACDATTAILAQGLTPTPTPLAKPNLKVEERKNVLPLSATLSWDPVPGATKYMLSHTDPLDGHWYGYIILDADRTSYTFSNLFPDTTYSYEVAVYPTDDRFPNPFGEITFTTSPDPVPPVTDITVKLGEPYQYVVRHIPGEYITWSVGNTSVATVDEDGNVTGLSIGNTYLYAKLPNGKTIKCLVRVGYPELSIKYTEKTLYPSSTFQFTADGAAGQKVTWSVGNTSVATVDSNGKVTGKSIANTYLYAKSADGRVAKCLLKVVDPGVLGINYTEKTIFLGQSYTFTAKNVRTFTPTWSVGNTAVAKVDSSGKVTSVSVGNTYLYVKTADGRSAKCLVKVVDPGPLNIRYTEKTVKVGATFQFAAKNPAGQTVSWRVGNTAVATVDANGVVTGKSVGNTWLYASTPDGREVKCLLRIVA